MKEERSYPHSELTRKIIELKSVEKLLPIHEAQIVNYLKATGIEVGLLINFGKKVEVKRKIFTNTK